VERNLFEYVFKKLFLKNKLNTEYIKLPL